jgi:transposase-like protein
MGENINEASVDKQTVRFDRDTIEREIRQRVRQVIEQVMEEELEAALGATPSQRVREHRRGCRRSDTDRPRQRCPHAAVAMVCVLRKHVLRDTQ